MHLKNCFSHWRKSCCDPWRYAFRHADAGDYRALNSPIRHGKKRNNDPLMRFKIFKCNRCLLATLYHLKFNQFCDQKEPNSASSHQLATRNWQLETCFTLIQKTGNGKYQPGKRACHSWEPECQVELVPCVIV
jgi:hypothetical protein